MRWPKGNTAQNSRKMRDKNQRREHFAFRAIERTISSMGAAGDEAQKKSLLVFPQTLTDLFEITAKVMMKLDRVLDGVEHTVNHVGFMFESIDKMLTEQNKALAEQRRFDTAKRLELEARLASAEKIIAELSMANKVFNSRLTKVEHRKEKPERGPQAGPRRDNPVAAQQSPAVAAPQQARIEDMVPVANDTSEGMQITAQFNGSLVTELQQQGSETTVDQR